MLRLFRRADPHLRSAARLRDAITARAREPVFYQHFGISDTIDGRFDLLALHCFLVMQGLSRQGKAGTQVGTHLATLTFAGFEDALRELGVGDMGLSRRIKAMANAFYGRLHAYAEAGKEREKLAAAILRNLYRGDAGHEREADRLADYALQALGRLADDAQAAKLMDGIADFGPAPQP